jgi:hypothetical protein
MLHLVESSGRAYDAETIAVMTAAFDAICQSLAGRRLDVEVAATICAGHWHRRSSGTSIRVNAIRHG